MKVKTKRGANRRALAIVNKCRRESAGGLSFGLDWPTLRATWPDRYAEIQRLRDLYKTLPD